MGRKEEVNSRKIGRLRKAAEAVKRVFTRGRSADETAEPLSTTPTQPQRARKIEPPQTARPIRREADIPLDVLDRAYTPAATSSKASFRSDGADHHQDQEVIVDDRWNDEDHFTNKSGDPRIGTRRRTYEATETRDELRNEQR